MSSEQPAAAMPVPQYEAAHGGRERIAGRTRGESDADRRIKRRRNEVGRRSSGEDSVIATRPAWLPAYHRSLCSCQATHEILVFRGSDWERVNSGSGQRNLLETCRKPAGNPAERLRSAARIEPNTLGQCPTLVDTGQPCLRSMADPRCSRRTSALFAAGTCHSNDCTNFVTGFARAETSSGSWDVLKTPCRRCRNGF